MIRVTHTGYNSKRVPQCHLMRAIRQIDNDELRQETFHQKAYKLV